VSVAVSTARSSAIPSSSGSRLTVRPARAASARWAAPAGSAAMIARRRARLVSARVCSGALVSTAACTVAVTSSSRWATIVAMVAACSPEISPRPSAARVSASRPVSAAARCTFS
jgi:hypothetical protein